MNAFDLRTPVHITYVLFRIHIRQLVAAVSEYLISSRCSRYEGLGKQIALIGIMHFSFSLHRCFSQFADILIHFLLYADFRSRLPSNKFSAAIALHHDPTFI